MDAKCGESLPCLPTVGSGEGQAAVERQRAYVTHSPLAILVADASGRYVEVNPAACRLSGYDEAELLAMSLFDLLADESQATAREHFAALKQSGRASGELCVVCKDGSKRWSTCDAVRHSEDRFIAYCLDVTGRREMEEALRRSQAELHALYDHVPAMVCALDSRRRVQYANRALREFAGQSAESSTGTCVCEILGCVQTLEDPRGCGFGSRCGSCQLRQAIFDTFQNGASHRGIEYRVTLQRNGKRDDMVFLVATAPVHDDGGPRLLVCFEDITERTHAEALLTAQRDLACRLAAARNLTEVARLCLDAAMESTGLECGGIYLVDPDSGTTRIACHCGLSGEFIESVAMVEPGSVEEHILHDGQPVVVGRRQMEEVGLLTALSEGLTVIVAVPVLFEERPVACVNLASRTATAVSPHALAALRAVAAHVGGAIARAQTEELLRQSDARYRDLFTNMLDGYAFCEMLYEAGRPRDFVYRDVNPAFERLTGLIDVVGRRVSEVIPGVHEANPELLEIYGRVALGGEPERFETYVESLRIWFSVAVFCPRKGYFVAVFDNITERKRLDQEQQIALEFLRLVNESGGLRDLIEKATAFIREQSGCEAAGIRLREGDDYPYFEARGFPADFVLAENSLCVKSAGGEPGRAGDGNPVLECMCGNVICGRFEASKPFFTAAGSFWTNSTTELLAKSTEADRLARTRNRCNGEGYESVALIRLQSGDEPLGLLQLNDRRKGRFTPRSIAFWERLAGYLAVAVAESRAEEMLRESEERYRSLFGGMTEGFALHEILCDERGEPCDYRFLDVNPAFERLTGLKRAEVLGKTVREVLPAEHARWIKTYGEVALTGRATRFESRSAALERYFDVVAYRPAPRQFATIFADVTDRKRNEDALRRSEQKLRMALAAGEIGTWVYAFADGTCEFGVQAQRLYGLPADQTRCHVGHLWARVHPDDLPAIFLAAQAARESAGDGRYRAEFRVLQPDGRWRWLSAWGQVEFEGTGQDRSPVRVVGASRDITGTKNFEEQLRLQSLVLDQIQDQVTVTDLQGVITYVNNAECSSAKRAREDLIGQSVTVYGEDPERGAAQSDIVRKTLADGEWRGEVVNYASDGTASVLDCRTSLVRSDEGRPLALCGISTDITERKQAEQSLRRSEERLRHILNAPLVAIGIGDAAGRIIEVNDAMVRLLGYSREELLSGAVSWKDFNPRENAELEARCFAELESTGQFGPCEMENIRKDGSRVPILIAAARLPQPANEHVVFIIDVADRRRAEQEKLELERRLLHAQKLESLGILAGGLAHDFNNILAGIMGYAELLKLRLPPSEPAREEIDVITKAVERAADLTRQMLAYSGKGKFLVEPVDLSRAVTETRKMLEVSVSKKAAISFRLASDLPAIRADASQIHQVVMNLVINASDALGENCGEITVSTDAVSCRGEDLAAWSCGSDLAAGLYVRLEVADTGCGMDPGTLEKIFDPFFSTKFTGRGLGLAAVAGIVRGHQGAIRVLSIPGQGTTFQVLFPAEDAPCPVAPPPPPETPWQGTGSILVVDDDEIIRMWAQRMFERIGFSVLTAADGDEALRVYRQHSDEIVCVLLDWTMPKMNGEETFRALCAIRPDVRVILSSGFSEQGATERFANLGLAGFVQKPYRRETMIAALRKALDAPPHAP